MLVEYFIVVPIERNKSRRYQRFLLLQAIPSWKGYPDSQRLNIIVLLNQQFIIIMQDKVKSNMVVIINADDFGYHQSIDRGIVQLIEKHHISSTSAIVNGQNIDNAAKQIRQLVLRDQSFLTSLSIGLHFNITQGEPLSQSILHSKLVSNGKFIGKPAIFEVAKQANSFSNKQIQEELLAQINKFIDLFGRKPSHIDGHNHVHLIPTIAPIIAKTMDSLGIYKTRIPLERLYKISLPINHMFLDYAYNAKEAYNQRGIIYCNEFVGLQSFGNLSSTLLLKAIQNQQLSSNGSVQMMCHPGYPALQGSQWIKSEDRLKEKEQLSSKQFKLLSQQYKYSNYYNLVDNQSSKDRKALICLTQQNRKYFMQIQLKIKFWIKDERIQYKINKIDLASVINSFNINHIVQIYSNQPQKYISQIAQNLALPLTLINSSETEASKLCELILQTLVNK